MLNEVPYNSDVNCIANTMLNEVPNSNDAVHVGNSVCLTTVDTQQFSMAAIYSHHAEKATYVPEMRDNDMITRKVYVDGNKLYPRKERRLYTQ